VPFVGNADWTFKSGSHFGMAKREDVFPVKDTENRFIDSPSFEEYKQRCTKA